MVARIFPKQKENVLTIVILSINFVILSAVLFKNMCLVALTLCVFSVTPNKCSCIKFILYLLLICAYLALKIVANARKQPSATCGAPV